MNFIRTSFVLLVVLNTGLAVGAQSITVSPAASRALASPVALNSPPVITSSIGTDFVETSPFVSARPVRFTVEVFDPDGDRVSLYPVALPGRLVVPPAHDAPSPVTRELQSSFLSGTLILEAHDDVDPEVKTRLEITFGRRRSVWRDDVTGDGIPDTITMSVTGGMGGTGAIYVFEGSSSPTPLATLRVSGPDPLPGNLRIWDVVDVTGDGIPDVVGNDTSADVGGVVDAGALFVWPGGAGLTGTVAPSAILSDPGATAGDEIGFAYPYPVVADVTGDGFPDIVTLSPEVEVAGGAAEGAIHVFAGGPSLAGAVAPVAVLENPYPSNNFGYDIHCLDVTGDGIDDVYLATELADLPGLTDIGAAVVWAGGPSLTGTPAPRAQLYDTSIGASAFGFDETLFADVTGDGVEDLIVTSYSGDFAGIDSAGVVHLWEGGPGLAGTPAPLARLGIPEDQPNTSISGAACADVDGDALLDVVVRAPRDRFGDVSSAGALYVWGNPVLAGSPPPTALLVDSDPTTIQLGANGMILLDVNDDGQVDVLAASDVGPLNPITYWPCGPTVLGVVQETASFRGPNNGLFSLGNYNFECEDVTGDARRDLIVADRGWTENGVTTAGAFHVYDQAVGWSGIELPTATITLPNPTQQDFFGETMLIADVTGDGIDDIVAGGNRVDLAAQNSGALSVTVGGPNLVGARNPDAILGIANAASGDASSGTTTALSDLTGDGVLDVVWGLKGADQGGVPSVGAIHVWEGTRTFSGSPAPDATLLPPTLETLALGSEDVVIEDLDQDGVDDVLAVTPFADVGAVDTGALFLWTTVVGTPPAQTQYVPGALDGAKLGDT